MGIKYDFNLDKHPMVCGRKPDLDPEQKGVLKRTKASKVKKELGDAFEQKVSERMAEVFPTAELMNDTYFETGNYIQSLLLYESIQIDHILITEEGIFCIESKWLDDNKYLQISGGALAKTWTLKTKRGTNNSDNNGLKQNYRHMKFIEELLVYEGIECPVYQMTVIGGISRNKIKIQHFMDANLVDFEELVDRINYISQRAKKNCSEKVDVKLVKSALEKWRCEDSAVKIQHLIYIRHLKDKKLPKRCKKITRPIK